MDSEMNARRAVPNAVWAEGLKLRIITAWRRRSGDSDFKQAGQDHAGGTWTGIRGSATGQPAEAASHIKLAAPLLNQKEAAVITAVAGMQDTGHFK